MYQGLPTLEAHRTAAPSAAFADLALNYGLDGIFAGDPEVSAREQEYIRHFCTTGELCLPVALRPGYETLYDRTFTCRPDSPKGLVRYQESRLLLLLWQHRAAGQLRGTPPPLRDHG